LTAAGRSGTLTVAGTTTSPATNVTVNGINAVLYSDATFAKDGFTLTNGNNSFTAIGKDNLGRQDTATITAFLPATVNYTYDPNGNLLSDGNRCFAYDDENELISVWVTNVWRSDFVYDGKRRRRMEQDYTWNVAPGAWNLTNEVHYVYDGNLVLQERDANNAPQVTYTRGKDLSGSLQGAGGIGGLLARTANPAQTSTYYHADGNGNITCLINSNQVVVARYLYDPFGNTLSASGSMADANLYRFSSKEYHPNSGLVYYLYRFYDPNLQRWLNRDPLGEFGFEVLGSKTGSKKKLPFSKISEFAKGPNLYIFVLNTPIDLIDTDGKDWWPPSKWPIWPKPKPTPPPAPPSKSVCLKCDEFRSKLNKPPEQRNSTWENDCQDFCLWYCNLPATPNPEACARSCNESCLKDEIPNVGCILETRH